MKAAILTDLTKCIGCEACVWACKDLNGLPREDGGKQLNSNTWTTIDRREGVNVRRQCMHCEDPACVSVCPVAAFEKTAEGPVIYHGDRCMGCRYCLLGCPFDAPKYQWDKAIPIVQKCILCFDERVKHGQAPACTSACPTGATVFGDRDELIKEAQRRIAAEPDRYVDHVYGLTEAGGTSVMYLSGVPFEKLGFKVGVQSDPYPRLTWDILSKLPNLTAVWGVTLAGVWWITHRRDEVAREERRHE
jgi:formate dehydrogenase iron-sulfur subunit